MCDPSYLAWCQQQGVSMYDVQPAYVATGWRGVVATQHIPPGQVVMTVPQQVLMSVLSAQQDPLLAHMLQRYQLNSHQVLVIHLLHEASKGAASRWWPYIQQLPRAYTNTLNWDTTALTALQVPYAASSAGAAVLKGRQEWSAARPLLQQLGCGRKWCSWSAWCWSASAVLSRTMYHPADPPTGCLTPLGDLHNYAPPPPPHTPQLQHDMETLIQQQQQQQQTVMHQKQLTQQQQQQHVSQQQGVGGSQLSLAVGGGHRQQQQQQQQQNGGTTDDLPHGSTSQLEASNSPSAAAAAKQYSSSSSSEDSCTSAAAAASARICCSSDTCSTSPFCQRPGYPAADAVRQCSSSSSSSRRSITEGCNPAAANGSAAGVGTCTTLPCSTLPCCQRPGSSAAAISSRASAGRESQPPPSPSAAVPGAAALPPAMSVRAAESAAAAGSAVAPECDTDSGVDATGAAAAAGGGGGDATAAGDTSGGAAAAAGAASGVAEGDAGVDVCCQPLCGDGHFDAAEGCYKIVARQSYAPGAEVFLCYGSHTNLELLELYGFMLEHNPHDTARLPAHTLQSHLQKAVHKHQQQQQQQHRQQQQQWPLVGRRAHCRRQQQQQQQQPPRQQGSGVVLDVAEAECWLHANGQPSWQLLKDLRCASACALGEASASYLALCGQPVSLVSELLVLQALAGACREQLAALTTSLAEDRKLMQGPGAAAAGPGDIAAGAAGGGVGDREAATQAAAASGAADIVDDVDERVARESATAEAASESPGGVDAVQHAAVVRVAAQREGEVKVNTLPAACEQRQQQQRECLDLAVRWRVDYKAALHKCVQRCNQLLAAAAAAATQQCSVE